MLLTLLFAPLLQFELIETVPSCDFDLFFPFIGLNEFDNTIFWLFSTGVLWCCFSYFNTETNTIPALDFKHEVLVNDLISKSNFNYISLLLSVFFVIFSSNFSGLLPYTQTITSQLLFTLILSFFIMFVIWVQAVLQNKIVMINHFLPNGAPLMLVPFIIAIELISNLSRLISLSVRLFANMTSGHALLKILAGFGLSALALVGVWKTFIIFPFIIIFIITILELIIAFLQTYVFVTLTLIYINEQE